MSFVGNLINIPSTALSTRRIRVQGREPNHIISGKEYGNTVSGEEPNHIISGREDGE
jgi:hypothetical protein